MPSLFDMGGGGAMSPWWMSGGGPLTYRPSLDQFIYGNQAPGMDPSMGAGGLMAPPAAPMPNMPPPAAPQVPPMPMPPMPPTMPPGGVLSPPGTPPLPPVMPPAPPVMPPQPGGNGGMGLGGGQPPSVGSTGFKGGGDKAGKAPKPGGMLGGR
jgi:hypothetical protein